MSSHISNVVSMIVMYMFIEELIGLNEVLCFEPQKHFIIKMLSNVIIC